MSISADHRLERYAERIRDKVPHHNPPLEYGLDVAELLTWMLDYNKDTRPLTGEVLAKL